MDEQQQAQGTEDEAAVEYHEDNGDGVSDNGGGGR